MAATILDRLTVNWASLMGENSVVVKYNSPALLATAVAAICLGILKILSLKNVSRARPIKVQPDTEERQRSKPKLRGHHYKSSSSIFDTHGTLLQAWKSPVSHVPLSNSFKVSRARAGERTTEPAQQDGEARQVEPEYQGWQNLAIVLMFFYLGSNAYYNRISFGSFFQDSGAYVIYVSTEQP